MKFLKPPVVEVWTSFEFDPAEFKTEPLDALRVKEFAQRVKAEFPIFEALHETTFKFEEKSASDLPRFTDRQIRLKSVRFWVKDRSRMMQIDDDKFSFHVLKTQLQTPRYRMVCDESQPKLEEYLSVFQPTQIRHAALNYLDIVDIPKPPNGLLNLQEYFPQTTDLPVDPFGYIASFTHQFQVMCPREDDPGPLFFRLQNLPSAEEQNIVRFRLDWHKQSEKVNTLDLCKVWKRMDIAHDYMWECFQATVSPLTQKLFEPVS